MSATNFRGEEGAWGRLDGWARRVVADELGRIVTDQRNAVESTGGASAKSLTLIADSFETLLRTSFELKDKRTPPAAVKPLIPVPVFGGVRAGAASVSTGHAGIGGTSAPGPRLSSNLRGSVWTPGVSWSLGLPVVGVGGRLRLLSD